MKGGGIKIMEENERRKEVNEVRKLKVQGRNAWRIKKEGIKVRK